MIILAIESSCDETACAIVKDQTQILSNVVSTQIDIHKSFGGVIPEVASRLHVEQISSVVGQAIASSGLTMDEVDAIAYTKGPGLVGCLHVGAIAAKTLAWYWSKPLIPVHHLAGHIYANLFVTTLQFPLLALVVSGGNSELVYMKEDYDFKVIGQTQDDAVGEAFDKVSKACGFGYPGGPIIDKLAKQGHHEYDLSMPKLEGDYDFSYSGLKTNVLQSIQKAKRLGATINNENLAYDFQKTAIDQLLRQTKKAIDDYSPKQLVLAGGVAANSYLRQSVLDLPKIYPDLSVNVPPLFCCTDNAAMIAAAAFSAYRKHGYADLSISSDPNWEIE